jgi:hypothetical protein
MKLLAYIVQEKRSWLLFSIFHAFTVVALMISMNLGCTLHVREGEKCLVRQVRVKHTCRVAPNQYARTIEIMRSGLFCISLSTLSAFYVKLCTTF